MKKYRVKTDSHVRLKSIDPDSCALSRDKEKAKEATEKLLLKMAALQETLYAEGRRSVLVVLQGMDTSGKDGVIRHVMRGVNPQSCRVVSFKEPNREELSHDFLWRVHRQVPPKGCIGIFNRSHYEDVLITRVHHLLSRRQAKERCKEIKQFEKVLLANGTRIVKFFLHISKEEQRKRLQARVDDPQKRWKFSPADVVERKKWNAYQRAYEETLGATSTEESPWYIVPANRKWYRNWVIARVIVDLLQDMDPRFPRPDPRLHLAKIKIR